jgi:WD repeat-containing protein 68
MQPNIQQPPQPKKQKEINQEIFTYNAPWMIFAAAFSYVQDNPYRLALGSFLDHSNNKVQIVQLNDDSTYLKKVAEFNHPFPPTKLMWYPDRLGYNKGQDLIASTGDFLRIWELNGNGGANLKALLNNKSIETSSPLTSFDWNQEDPKMIVTSSVDSMCTVWNIETQKPLAQIVTHDKEVYDVAFSEGKNVFASVGADGTLRMFDLRNLKNSMIIYETQDKPLLKIGWNKQDPNYIVTMAQDMPAVVIDIRIPSFPAAELSSHTKSMNAVCWAPHSSGHLCTVGDDAQALIWDISELSRKKHDPILAYQADAAINQLQWSACQPDWIAICFSNILQMLRI